MARKRQKNLRIDEAILDEFEKIANRKKQQHNTEIEELMKAYIARDGQLIFDDLYAPRIEHAVKQAVESQINRLAKMIYQTQVDATASMYSAPVFHIESLRGIENILETYIRPEVLNPSRVKVSDQYTFNHNGKLAVKNLRKVAYMDHQENKKAKQDENNAI
ncbi:hypothetical protein [Peribacillus asahii]|uniref:hypothetical protein n=1 Tax=Peribacillus asahii TaxID=228899 RepID=UPI00207A0081|nr:hypothetical protein [Peribacillus asahii]USK72633.1 hypothetical protein LIS76_23600 [Peribacillus asahii]USK72749.1 hypothetical protein LIS76_23780 [Peribacillus asahii]